jgi:CubicO group peptidase (beta-lactamase class C family)
MAAGGQSLAPPSSRSSTDTLASRLAASIRTHKVPGASAAVFRGGQWEVAAAGVTNVSTGVDVTAETVMHIGSITKVLTATLVMQLVDEGRVQLEAPLKRYLPDFQVANRDATELITVQMLLNHTCGIDGDYFPDAGPDADRIVDVVPVIAQQGQIHAPGAELSYSNSGAVLAGYLAQRLLGKSWYALVEERIFEPLELQHSVVRPADALLHRASVGHFLNDGTNTRTSFAFLNPSFAPAGTTAMLAAKDLASFALAHMNDGVAPNGHRLLSAASARQMRRQTAGWRGVGAGGFGLGWMTMDKGIVGHDGGGPGIVSWLYADPAAKTVAAVLTNAAHGGAVADEITGPLYEAAGAKPPWADYDEMEKQATDIRVDPKSYVGQYESVGLVLRVIPREEGLALRVRRKVLFYDGDTLDESPPIPLRPIRDGHFTTGQGFVTFLNPGTDGRMQHMASRRRLYKRSG